MQVILLVLAILLVGFAFAYNRVLGASLLIVIVLSMWLTAHKRGII
jgi:hypothetical protein